MLCKLIPIGLFPDRRDNFFVLTAQYTKKMIFSKVCLLTKLIITGLCKCK